MAAKNILKQPRKWTVVNEATTSDHRIIIWNLITETGKEYRETKILRIPNWTKICSLIEKEIQVVRETVGAGEKAEKLTEIIKSELARGVRCVEVTDRNNNWWNKVFGLVYRIAYNLNK